MNLKNPFKYLNLLLLVENTVEISVRDNVVIVRISVVDTGWAVGQGPNMDAAFKAALENWGSGVLPVVFRPEFLASCTAYPIVFGESRPDEQAVLTRLFEFLKSRPTSTLVADGTGQELNYILRRGDQVLFSGQAPHLRDLITRVLDQANP